MDPSDIEAAQRQAMRQLLRQPYPGAVAYHYTSLAGLLGILESQRLRAGSRRFMNDPNEETTGRMVWQRALDQHDELKALLGPLDDEFDRFEVFVACFSLERDRLSQWLGYGNKGQGFALGFDAQQFSLQSLRRGTVMYEPAEHEQMVADCISTLLNRLPAARGDQLEQFGLRRQAAMLRMHCEVFCKQQGYSEEHEFRVVATVPRSIDASQPGFNQILLSDDSLARAVHFKESLYGLSAYVELPTSSAVGALKEIVVGPKLDFASTRRTLQHMLMVNGLPDVEIVPSRISYR